MKTFLPLAFHKNEWKNFADANVSIATSSLHYGIGSFGGYKSSDDAPVFKF